MIVRLVAAVLGLVITLSIGHTHDLLAADNDENVTPKFEQKEKDQREKNKEFNRDIIYQNAVGPDVLPLGPFTISLYVDGLLIEHRVKVALQAVNTAKKDELEEAKTLLFGIVYPLCLKLFENGRPSSSDILAFKAQVRKNVSNRFKGALKDVYIASVL